MNLAPEGEIIYSELYKNIYMSITEKKIQQI